MVDSKRYALISMPWKTAYMPSIQLGTLKTLLSNLGIASDIYDFNLEFASSIGPALYRQLDNDSFVLAEKIFSPFAFPQFAAAHEFPEDRQIGSFSADLERAIFYLVQPIVQEFLTRCIEETDWSQYSAFCFSLTTVQTTSSIALAKRLKERLPSIPIVFGGTSCAGEMGTALARLSTSIDVVVHGEAETSISTLVNALSGLCSLSDVPGITYRDRMGVKFTGRPELAQSLPADDAIDFSSYFERASRLGLFDYVTPWIPFETSKGCWFGEKQQCTFCGLNETIAYRKRDPSNLIANFVNYEKRYGVSRFFSVDLIMPHEFPRTILPAIERAREDWTIFYEVKSNMKKLELQQLARAGVRWIQPGIESLHDSVLKLMKKGVSAGQNVAFLKWCKELDIDVNWNLITGFPDEQLESYEQQIAMIPKIKHLQPPTGVGDFEVHRFSPYANEPEKYGLRILGADWRYRYVFPSSQVPLEQLVYRFDHALTRQTSETLQRLKVALSDAVKDWWHAFDGTTNLTFRANSDGTAEILDTRKLPGTDERYALLPAEAALYIFLDSKRATSRLSYEFREQFPMFYTEIGGETGIKSIIAQWSERSVVLSIGSYIVALAIPSGERCYEDRRSAQKSEDLYA